MNEFERAKQQVMEGTKRRCNHRMNVLVDIVNKELVSRCTIKMPTFVISDASRQQLISRVLSHISHWIGGKYAKDVKSFDDWYSKARIWWNRGKAIKLGNDLFAPIMMKIQQFLQNECKQLADLDRLQLFLDIFISILSTNIIFKQTMPRSLIPHQTFMKNNTFKIFAETFVRNFEFNDNEWLKEWNNLSKVANGNSYIPNKNRSSQVFFTYLGHFKQIKNNFFKITNNKQIEFQYILQKEKKAKIDSKIACSCQDNNNFNYYNKIIFALADAFMENNNSINNLLLSNGYQSYRGVRGSSRHVSDVRYDPFGCPYYQKRNPHSSNSLCSNVKNITSVYTVYKNT